MSRLTVTDQLDIPRSDAPSGVHRAAMSVTGFLPGVVLALICVASVIRNGVAPTEVFAYSAYWFVTLIVPGTLLARFLLGRRQWLPEDLAVGAVTGVALELAAWVMLRLVGLDGLVRWWWSVPILIFAVLPQARHLWRLQYPESAPRSWSWAMTGVSSALIMGLDLSGLRSAPLPPAESNVYVDSWWHLAMVKELMRPGPAELPQVAGEPLNYHFFSHAHMAVASETSGVAAEVVLFRLWFIPLVIVGLVLAATLTRSLTNRNWSGPVAAWIVSGALMGGFLWSGLPVISRSPFSILSPSQILAVPIALGGALVFTQIARGTVTSGSVVWLALMVHAGSEAKPTVVLTFLGGTLLAGVACWFCNRKFPLGLALLSAGLVVVQVISLLTAPSQRSTSITILGTLKSLGPYQELTGDTTLRAVNEGLLLDSLNGGRAYVAAGVTLIWFVGTQALRVVGLFGLVGHSLRRDGAAWWLAGALLTGWFVAFVLDHSGFSQIYFLHLALPFGAILSVWFASTLIDGHSRERAFTLVGLGLLGGALIALVSQAAVEKSAEVDSFGVIERILLPVVVLLLGLLILVVVASGQTRLSRRSLGLLCVTALLGITISTSISVSVGRAIDWARAPEVDVNPEGSAYLTSGEQVAALWLGENSDPTDIVATNTQCRPLTTDLSKCNAVGFFLGGLSGRRVVIEGWGYTGPAHEAHGNDGAHRNRQPPGWPERYELSIAAIEAPTRAVLEALRDDYGADWIFASHRAGPVSDELARLAPVVFDNGEVTIYQLG